MRQTRSLVIALLLVAACVGGTDVNGDSTQISLEPTTSKQPSLTPTTTQTTLSTRVTTVTTSTVPRSTTISCRDAELSPPPHTALTFYALCRDAPWVPYPMYRPGSTTPTLEQSVVALLAGTTPAENALGLYTGLDGVDGASQVDVNTSIDPNGTAHIALQLDGTPWLPATGEWTSNERNPLLDPLLATVFASDGVTGLDMTTLCFEQITCDRIVTRAEWAGTLFTNTGLLLHGDCTPEFARGYPDRCTLDGVLARPTVAGTVTNVNPDDSLKVRSGPGTEFFTLGELAPGATVAVTTEASVATDGGIWRLINSGQSGAGWVNEAFLDIARTPAETLVDAFVEFAHHPTTSTFSDLPLADIVALGLGPTILKTVDGSDLRWPQVWQVELEYFRAYVGPFSAVETLSGWDIYDTTIGEHPHCASPPTPAPDGYEYLDRISVQPRLGLQSSCLDWGTVDFFVLPDGNVTAITLDVWEP